MSQVLSYWAANFLTATRTQDPFSPRSTTNWSRIQPKRVERALTNCNQLSIPVSDPMFIFMFIFYVFMLFGSYSKCLAFFIKICVNLYTIV